MPVQGATAPSYVPPETAYSPPPAPLAVAAVVKPRIDTHCKDLAQQRMEDSGYSGLDEETQRAVYNGTYTQCVTWEQAHGAD